MAAIANFSLPNTNYKDQLLMYKCLVAELTSPYVIYKVLRGLEEKGFELWGQQRIVIISQKKNPINQKKKKIQRLPRTGR